ncbi:ran-binding protein 10-like [Gossypium australe]|uniref:Ran-binding protein 10-like n=1 Tax=Gossypium australe TaxID=47621 RepID=A0A5B6UAY2_9ROSI|nr:ran-binding protein 10-like [Gossypium australe]
MNSSNSNNGQSNSGKSSNFYNLNQDLGLHFLELARIGSSKAPVEMEEDEEEAPKELNTINSSGGFLVVAPDKLSVKYTSVSLHGHDVGVVQADKPAPMRRLLYYFEIYVKDAGAKGQIAIGFTNEGFKMRRQPGWEVNSCGYHGDDGLLYRGQGKGDAFGPTYTTGDTVGGGINYASQEFFFTKNGAIVGTVSKEKEMKGCLFPTIAVHSQNEEVHVNFGQKKFAFDVKASYISFSAHAYGILSFSISLLPQSVILSDFLNLALLYIIFDAIYQEYEAQERLKQQMTIEKISLPPNISYGLVRSYLLHYGYEDTLNSFDLASKSTIPPICIAQENGFDEQDVVYALNQRKTIRQLIRNGEIDAAMNKLRDWYPQIVQDDKSAACFLLHCQKFIELIRVGALEEAVKHGRIELYKFFGSAEADDPFDDLVQKCVALLAYERPQESPVGYLLEESHRDVVADTVNAMILSTNPKMEDVHGCIQSYLERLLRQLTACCVERRSANGGQGEAFHLHRLLNSSRET